MKFLRSLVVLMSLCALTAPFTLKAQGTKPAAPHGVTRTYYIAADDVTWDYVAGGVDGITCEPFKAVGFFKGGPKPDAPPITKPVSTSYRKTIYHEYTDESFRTLKSRPAAWEHLGMMGPLIRAEVGDTIKVVFRNNGHHPYSMHPHGVFYTKSSEGAPYDDGTSGADKADDAVPPGGTHTYAWEVPERVGPGAGRLQLRALDVSLAYRRVPRSQHWPAWPNHHHRPRPIQARRRAKGLGSRVRSLVCPSSRRR
jgi:FtsP/CotA-like multicopper oxidase with cupredoxin domain